MRPVILDTDIGTDVDDILALVLLAKSPDLRILGVTTVYGDTVLRAKMAKATCAMLDQSEIQVIPGASRPRSGRQVYWAGFEGEGIPNLDGFSVDESQSAESYLTQSAKRLNGELEILAIGPLTNIANAILSSVDFGRQVKHLYIMGGSFWKERYEHNIRCDVDSARIVLSSGMKITAVGLDLTTRVWLGEKDVRRIAAIPGPLGAVLEDQIRTWWEYRGINENHPHDPLAALTMVRPDLFLFEECDVVVGMSKPELGWTKVTNRGHGTIRIASDFLVRTAEKEIVDRIVGQGSAVSVTAG
ncbi:MAG: nucleoside hydrolase [Verrucomicrobia bacterium]|nr:nucleoside hydrolase [Verrucomicrobiota bacterium]